MRLLRVEPLPASTVLAFGDDAIEQVISLDREGRPFYVYDRERAWKRGLDGRLHVRGRDASGRRLRKTLSRPEALRLYGRWLDAAAVASEALGPRAREILRWTPEALLDGEGRRYRAAYRWPVSILPPDAYLDVVLQATYGCTWNRCTFCAFYRDRPFQKRDPEAFRDHVEAVRALLGRGIALRKGIFLADGNALALGEAILPLFDIARAAFPGRSFAAFLDLWSGSKKTPDWWRRLFDRGLRKVAIGVESGDPSLLRTLNKPGDPRELLPFVRTLKEAGLALRLIFLVGAGGAPFREAHLSRSLDLLAALPLGPEDVVYLSPLVPEPGTPYAAAAPEPVEDLDAELIRWASSVRRLGLRVSRYDIREFVY
ncbi:radical SAM protein [Hydrogenibacillus schlegelii]|uniref:Amino acid ABC transporter substrate-binding protein n=1 Tax=Hydrogenibacillus schlegelii TaxID=1484 RepID=A0A132N9V1_HYDSH|nr:radical SAM protein [Hydrogenibacillus schlegelii]KWX06941.1 amino acid ABC transporter substrate-binding protein [Hydrogenibacillus schlegelii]OAR05100.1 amino acid ABC transporter substrate-binding protein [Hydrogenibacillus schlegelii]